MPSQRKKTKVETPEKLDLEHIDEWGKTTQKTPHKGASSKITIPFSKIVIIFLLLLSCILSISLCRLLSTKEEQLQKTEEMPGLNQVKDTVSTKIKAPVKKPKPVTPEKKIFDKKDVKYVIYQFWNKINEGDLAEANKLQRCYKIKDFVHVDTARVLNASILESNELEARLRVRYYARDTINDKKTIPKHAIKCKSPGIFYGTTYTIVKENEQWILADQKTDHKSCAGENDFTFEDPEK